MGAKQGVFDDGSYPVVIACVWTSSFLLKVVALSVRILFLWQASGGKRRGIPYDLC